MLFKGRPLRGPGLPARLVIFAKIRPYNKLISIISYDFAGSWGSGGIIEINFLKVLLDKLHTPKKIVTKRQTNQITCREM